MAIQLRRGDYTDFDPSQLLDGELAIVLENDPDTEDGTGTYVSYGSSNVKRLLTEDDNVEVPIASSETAGIVKPDGTSITVDADGTIHGSADVPIATTSTYGLVKPDGTTVKVNGDGALSVPTADAGNLGLVKPDGTSVTVDNDGTLHTQGAALATSETPGIVAPDDESFYVDSYDGRMTLNYATDTTLGGVKISEYEAVGMQSDDHSLYVKTDETTITKNEYGQLTVIGGGGGGGGGSDIDPYDSDPEMDGTASAGSSTDYARGDHVHPTDTSRAAASDLTSHTSDSIAHVTAAERSTWNAKASTATATTSANGLMSASDKSKLDGIESGANNYELPAATTSTLGGVKADGTTILVDADGTIHGAGEQAVPLMSPTTRGGAKLGHGLAIEDGALGIGSVTDPTDAGPIVELTAKGWAEQDTTVGKNLWPKMSDSTSSGITWTVNADGSVTANGTATAEATKTALITLAAGTYTISAGIDTSRYANYRGYAQTVIDGVYETVAHTTNNPTFTLSESTAIRLVLRISNGYTANNLTFYPQLELGSTATSYEPYSGGAPSPDYPQEIQVVTGHTISGKTGRFVDILVTHDGTTTTIPIPLPSRGWVAALPDGTCDTLTLDGAGGYVWTLRTRMTTQAVTDGVTGTVGVNVMSSTGQIANGATVLYKGATTTESGYVSDMPIVPVHAAISSTDLHDLAVRCCADEGAAEIAAAWGRRYESRIANLESAVATLVTAGA